jgi:natural resistance-associated macrophage protein 2
LDPGNLEADLQVILKKPKTFIVKLISFAHQAGAYSKYQLLWVLFYAQFVGFILQNMATRIGIVTGKHLAQLCKEEYGPRTVKSLWICAELSIVACDVQAVITSAIALRILFGWPLWVGCVVTGVDAITFLTLDTLGVHSLEGFFVLLVGMMAVCFFWNFSVNPPHASGE